MKKYDAPEEECYVCHFRGPGSKELREYYLFPIAKKIFINCFAASSTAFLCACCDGIPILQNKKNKAIFVDIDWLIDEKIGGKEASKDLTRLKNEALETHKDCLGKKASGEFVIPD